MNRCKKPHCGSWAINHHSHGRDGSDDGLCVVCYWRKRATEAATELRHLAAVKQELEALKRAINDAKPVAAPNSVEFDGIKTQPAQQEPDAMHLAAMDLASNWALRIAELETEVALFRANAMTEKAAQQALEQQLAALVPLTDKQMHEVRQTSCAQLLDLAKQWADNKIHVYQFTNEAEKIITSVARRVEAAHGIK